MNSVGNDQSVQAYWDQNFRENIISGKRNERHGSKKKVDEH